MVHVLAPPALGRGIILGDTGSPPAAWAETLDDGVVPDEIVVDEQALLTPGPIVAALHAAWRSRTPVIVRLLVDPARFRQPVGEVVEPWTLPPDHEVFFDRLHFLVWANNYDARTGEPVWWWTAKAARLGAEPAGADEYGDVRLPSGAVVWIDGGPRGTLTGVARVHADSVELGRLTVAPEPEAPTAELAADQLAAVSHSAGPARVIAPAGSGKTRVLTERLRQLLGPEQRERESVLAVAYNVRARDELVERTSAFRPRVQTLNGLGYEILGAARGSAPRVLDEREIRRIVDGLLPGSRVRRANTDPIAPYLEALGIARQALRDPADIEVEREDVPGLSALFAPYRAALRSAGGIDFDEQIYGAIEALLADGELRRRFQGRCRHVLVDEFQDLTPAHVLMLRLLSSPRLDVFGVGDDDQVIYGHAGASPRFLIEFDRLFPGAAVYALEVNHRCPAVVVTAAADLLSWNLRRVPKSIRPGPAAPAGVERLLVQEVATDQLASAARDTVSGWLESGLPTSSIAVLARVNASLLAPQIALAEAGVPLQAALGPDVLQRLGVRAALAYLRLACSPDSLDRDDLVEVYRRPSRGLPEWIVKWFRAGMSLDALNAVSDRIDDEKVAVKLSSLVADLELLAGAARRGRTTRHLLAMIREQVGLGEAMAQLDRSKAEGSSQLDDLEALEQVADLHPDPASFGAWLRGLLGRAPSPDGITLATVHKVKGREWPAVIVYGASAGLLPHRLAEDEEEERRVLHVAITRGRERVVVLADTSRPSPFLPQLRTRAPDEVTSRAAPGDAPRPTARAATTGRTGGSGSGSSGLGKKAGAATAPLGDPDNPVFVALKGWRTEEARTLGMPPYVVFADRVLHEIARVLPTTTRELAAVTGVGPAKLERYGDDVLRIVAQLAEA